MVTRRPPTAFISYRRQDTAEEALTCARELRRAFGGASIFVDVEEIEPGAVWSEKIGNALDGASVVLVFIGPKWLKAADEDGRRRLDNRRDWVRREIVQATRGDKVVIPVLVGSARLPPPRALPRPLQVLLRYHAVELNNELSGGDFSRLIGELEERGFRRRTPRASTRRAGGTKRGTRASRNPHAGDVQREQYVSLKLAGELVYQARNAARTLFEQSAAPRKHPRPDRVRLSDHQADLENLLAKQRVLLPPRVFDLLHQIKYQLIEFKLHLAGARTPSRGGTKLGTNARWGMLLGLKRSSSVHEAYNKLDASYQKLIPLVQRQLGTAGRK